MLITDIVHSITPYLSIFCECSFPTKQVVRAARLAATVLIQAVITIAAVVSIVSVVSIFCTCTAARVIKFLYNGFHQLFVISSIPLRRGRNQFARFRLLVTGSTTSLKP